MTQQSEKSEKIRILIVDDIPETRENLRKLLYFENDIEVAGAADSGESGIAMAGELKPDVVLMDINMPGIDGITATQAISEQVPNVGVIMMSVQGETDYLRRSMQAGAREFLIKPFSSDDLISGIRRVHELGASQREAALVTPPPAHPGYPDRGLPPHEQGKVLAVFSPKGGTGCSTVAINLAVALKQMSDDMTVALVDASLQFGDVAVLLNLQSSHSIVDLAPHVEELDRELIESVMHSHHSGVKALLAPPRPEMADQVTAELLEKTLTMLRGWFKYIVVDAHSVVSDITLSAMDLADRIVLIATPDIPSIKDAKLFFEVTDALEYPASKTVLILNKANPQTGIRAEDIQASIKHPIAVQLPLDERTAGHAANQGVPYVSSARNTKLTQATMQLAHHLVSITEEKEDMGEAQIANRIGAAN